MMLLILLFVLGFATTADPACLLACDQVTTGPAAEAQVEALLGAPLPPQAAVAGLVVGGFQDLFVQARIETDEAGLDALLSALGASREALEPATGDELGPPGPAWWDPQARDALRIAPGGIAGFASVTLGVAPGMEVEGGWTIYIWAFQT